MSTIHDADPPLRARAGILTYLDRSSARPRPSRMEGWQSAGHVSEDTAASAPESHSACGGPPWLDDLAAQWRALLIEPQQQAEHLFQHVQRIARALGFEHCAYGLRLPLPFTHRSYLAMNNYHPDWRKRYVEQNYIAQDPTVCRGARSTQPIIWSDALFSGTPDLWSEARSFGLRYGWAQSCFDEGGRVGMLSVARSHAPLTAAELAAHEFVLHWLVNVTHRAIAPLLTQQAIADVRTLTPRERDVMTWSADGKTSADAALILGISERTVKFHVMNAMAKLRVNTKTAAAAHALILGMLN